MGRAPAVAICRLTVRLLTAVPTTVARPTIYGTRRDRETGAARARRRAMSGQSSISPGSASRTPRGPTSDCQADESVVRLSGLDVSRIYDRQHQLARLIE